jgi:serine/threonine protein kinase
MALQEAQPRDPLIGARIDGRYTVHGMLGRGGMGVVYDGVHDELGRPVAIKVLNAAWASDPVAVARFLREARTAGSLSHGNIVDVSDLGRLPDGRPYLVMPKVKGTDLASLLQHTGPQPPKRVAELLSGVAAALDLIHAKGLVHRDIKPENLMYVVREDSSETVMLLDFGIAALVASTEPRLTRQGAIFGTPAYLPPEVWDGKVPDRRGDVYALATVAFELMTGELPFVAENVMHLLPMKLRAPAPSMTSVSAMTFPAEIEALIARGLAREPGDRFDTASDLVGALRLATAAAPVSWRPGVLSANRDAAKPPDLERSSTTALEEPLLAMTDSAALAIEAKHDETHSEGMSSGMLALPHADTLRSQSSASEALLRAAPPAQHTTNAAQIPVSPARRWLAYGGAGVATVLVALWGLSANKPAPEVQPVPHTSTAMPTPKRIPDRTPEPQHTLPTSAARAWSAAPTADEPLPSTPQAPARRAASPAMATRTPPSIAKPTPQPKPSSAPPVIEVMPAASPLPVTASRPAPIPDPAPTQPTALAHKDPDSAEAAQLTREGTSALLGGQVAHATDLLRRATRADPSQRGAWRSLGLALEQSGHARDAIDAYQRYLDLEPHGAQADKVRERIATLNH